MRLLRPICAKDSGLITSVKKYTTDSKMSVRGGAMLAMGEFGKVGIPTLIAGLNDPDLQVVCAAATALSRFGPDARAAMPVLEDLLCTKSIPADTRCGTFCPNLAVRMAMQEIDADLYQQVNMKLRASKGK